MSVYRAADPSVALRALARYQAELVEIAQAHNDLAASVGKAGKPYFPTGLADEARWAESCSEELRWLAAGSLARLGRHMPAEYLGLIKSALKLYRASIVRDLEQAAADPLILPTALRPLEEEQSAIDSQLADVDAWPDARFFGEVERRQMLKLGLRYPVPRSLEGLLAAGEGQEVEFIERVKTKDTHSLGKEIAAFGSTNAGTILLGVRNDGEVTGLPDLATPEDRDRLQVWIEQVGSNTVQPSLLSRVAFETHEGLTVARISVPKGPEPVYFSSNTAYVRHGSLSRPALPQEVTRLVARALTAEHDSRR